MVQLPPPPNTHPAYPRPWFPLQYAQKLSQLRSPVTVPVGLSRFALWQLEMCEAESTVMCLRQCSGSGQFSHLQVFSNAPFTSSPTDDNRRHFRVWQAVKGEIPGKTPVGCAPFSSADVCFLFVGDSCCSAFSHLWTGCQVQVETFWEDVSDHTSKNVVESGRLLRSNWWCRPSVFVAERYLCDYSKRKQEYGMSLMAIVFAHGNRVANHPGGRTLFKFILLVF